MEGGGRGCANTFCSSEALFYIGALQGLVMTVQEVNT